MLIRYILCDWLTNQLLVVCVFAGAERPSRAADGLVCLDVLGYSRSLMACGQA